MNDEKELLLERVNKFLKLYTSADSIIHRYSECYVTWKERAAKQQKS